MRWGGVCWTGLNWARIGIVLPWHVAKLHQASSSSSSGLLLDEQDVRLENGLQLVLGLLVGALIAVRLPGQQ